MASTHVIHDAASKGFHNASSYDAHRPSYGDAAVSSLLKHLGLEGEPQSRIVDLGAGTGKFTEVLAARPEEFEIIAVEPLDSMRETLAEKQLKGVETRAGTASNMETVETGWADGCIVAQAFHWFAKEESLKEIHRVLKPGTKLGLIWNVEDYNRPASWPAATTWEHELGELSFSGHSDGQPRFRHLQWRKVFDLQAESEEALFSTPIGTERVQWSVWLTPEGLWDRINTLSWNAIREGEAKREFREKFDKILKGGDGKWNDKGEIEFHGSTFFAWTARL
ncbi:S-adenosyl-L-methionine-dependent methyltransferase [Ilyonectria destructans]|nr:S-adenosyl-L-methionine-dependent methyltransferase [Ilyonectria destructans]